MTKMKSRKMTKSTFAIIIMAVAMVAMLAFGGTYAYFTAQAAPAEGSFNTGKISVSNGQVAVVESDYGFVPKQTVIESISFKNDSTVAAYLFVTLEAKIGVTDVPKTVLNLTPINGWSETTEGSGIFYKLTTDAAPETTSITVCQNVEFNANVNYVEGAWDKVGTDGDLMGQTIVVTLKAAAVQAYGVEGTTPEQKLASAISLSGIEA